MLGLALELITDPSLNFHGLC